MRAGARTAWARRRARMPRKRGSFAYVSNLAGGTLEHAHRLLRYQRSSLSLVGQNLQEVRPMPVCDYHAKSQASPAGVEWAPLSVSHLAVHNGIKATGEAQIAQLLVSSCRRVAIEAQDIPLPQRLRWAPACGASPMKLREREVNDRDNSDYAYTLAA